MRTPYRFRLYPSKSQSGRMHATLDLCRELYNAALQERRDAWRVGVSVNCYAQQRQIPYIRKSRIEFQNVYAQVLQDVLRRINEAFVYFFIRCKNHEKPGYPRFRGNGQYLSFTFPQYGNGVSIVGKSVRLSKIGNVQMKIHRPIDGIIKTCTISRSSTGKWFASFYCEVEMKHLQESTKSIGIDVGLHSFAVLSNGETIPNPRFFQEYEKRLAKSQRKMEKQSKGSIERHWKGRVISRIHEKITNKRSDFVHQKSREIVNRYGIICIEDLAVHRMMKNKIHSKGIQDAAWGQFARCLSYKAEHAGRKCKSVNPAFTSQTCSRCGSLNHEFLERMFHCLNCDSLIDRDHNAAINIERLGLQSLGLVKTQEAPGFQPVGAVT